MTRHEDSGYVKQYFTRPEIGPTLDPIMGVYYVETNNLSEGTRHKT